MSTFTHFDAQGQAHMVDVADKAHTHRVAVATGTIHMQAETWKLIESGTAKKGDVLGIARIAGIQAAKKASDLIPLCHPLLLSKVEVQLEAIESENKVRIESVCKLAGKTGVEMEALTAASVAALTIYDMCKAVQKDMVIGQVRLLEKTGGKSGHFKAES